jgi:hypothetical protein
LIAKLDCKTFFLPSKNTFDIMTSHKTHGWGISMSTIEIQKTTTVRLDKQIWTTLKEASYRQERSMGYLMRKFIREGLDREFDLTKQPSGLTSGPEVR